MEEKKYNRNPAPGFGLWERVKRCSPGVLAAFVAAFVFGYVIHLYAFTNTIPNPDGLSRIYDTQQMTISGRWFLHYASYFHGFVQSPALIGFLSVLFLALAAAVVADLLELRSPAAGALAGTMMVAIPSVAYTFLYMFTASAYMFGILLAVLAVWCCNRSRWGILAGAVLIACAMGIYQAYLPLAAALALCVVIRRCLDPEMSAGDVVRKGVSFLITILLGIALYYLMLKIFLAAKDLSLISYKNINDASAGVGGGLVASLWSAYKDFIFYFTIPGTTSYVTKMLVLLNILLAVLSLVTLLILIRKNRCTGGKLILLLAAFLLMPLAVNCMAVVSKQAPIMRYAFVSVYLLAVMAIALLEQVGEKNVLHAGLRITAAAAVLLIILMSAQTDNLAYTESETAHRSTQRFLTTLVTRVESMPGYENGMEVAIVGTFPEDIYYSKVLAYNEVRHYSSPSSSVLMANKHIYYYLNDWLNVQWKEPSEDTMKAISDSPEFQSMPLYPNDGSVAIIDGRVLVRLSPQYTPKQYYEIEYENRR